MCIRKGDAQQLLAWRQMPMEAMACLAQAAPHIDLRKEPRVCVGHVGEQACGTCTNHCSSYSLNHVLPQTCGAASPSGLIAAHHQAVAGCTLDEHGKDKPQLQVRTPESRKHGVLLLAVDTLHPPRASSPQCCWKQFFFDCDTCEMEAVCAACAEKCHKGHDLERDEEQTMGWCDCGLAMHKPTKDSLKLQVCAHTR